MRGRIPAAAIVAAVLSCSAWCAEPVVRIPPVATHIEIQGQPVEIRISGEVFADDDGGQETVRVLLSADLSDLQRNLTPILAAQLNQSNRCGERLNVLGASLVPATPAAILTLNAHVEKWACAKAFGKEVVKRFVGGNGTIVVRLTPKLEDAPAIKLAAEVTSLEADGSLGELLRSGPFAETIREKIRGAVVSALEKSTDFKTTLPPAAQQLVSIREVQFAEIGDGRLGLRISSEVRIPAAQARELLERLKAPTR
jgi:hypothetical protein